MLIFPRLILMLFFVLLGSGKIFAQDTLLNPINKQVQKVLDRLHTTDGFPGATAAYILADGSKKQFSIGYEDREARSRMSPDARMLSGSTGKSFVAAVALNMALENKLSLDTPIKKWLAEKPWFIRLPNGGQITLRMLLRHQSGLTDHISNNHFKETMRKGLRREGPEFKLEPEQLVQFILDTEPLFPAGKGYHYSDTNYILVGLIIEAITGNSYNQELRERFLNPLELKNTDPSYHNMLTGLAAGYIKSPLGFDLPPKVVQNNRLVYNPATEWTGGGLVTNSGDLAFWAKTLYEGRAMKAHYLDQLLNFVPKDSSQKAQYGPEVGYGLGVTTRVTPLGKAYGHRGWTPGYLSIFEYYPQYKMAVAIQVNEFGAYDMSSYAIQLASTIISFSPMKNCHIP